MKFKSTKALRHVPEICDDGELERRIEIDGSIAVGDLTCRVDGADKERIARFPDPVKPIRSTMFEATDSLRDTSNSYLHANAKSSAFGEKFCK